MHFSRVARGTRGKLARLGAVVLCISCSVASALMACSGSSSGDDSAAPLDGSNDTTTAPSDGGTDALDPAAVTACNAYVDAYCAKLRACQGYSFACEAQKALCPDFLFASGSTLTPADVSQCTVQLAGATCVDFFNNPPAACVKPGERKAGASCAFNSQCESATCVNGVSHCGYCARVVDPGESCGPQGVVCPSGQACDYQTGQCGPSAAPGSPCSVVNPPYVSCPTGLQCTRTPDQTADQTTCEPYAQPGQPCNVEPFNNSAFCDYTTGSCDLYDASAGAGNCVAFGNPGDPCGDNGSGLFIECNGANSYCEYEDGGAKGTCRALVGVGQPCGPTGGPTYVQCDPSTSFCKLQVAGQPGVCTALLTAGTSCAPQPQHYADGGASGGSYSVACAQDAVCTNNYCYFGFEQDAAPPTAMCVTGGGRGIAGDSCGHGQCDTCATGFACVDHQCTLPDLSSCN